jgi:CMP-N,N'-diacetyllegionaminic acid synthase
MENFNKRVILGVITARGGSKGIKKKNIAVIAGEPLIVYTIEAALKSKMLTDVVVSTDSKEIAETSNKAGLLVLSLRPSELARDESPTLDVLHYEILQYEAMSKKLVDYVMVLQPTSPLRTAENIDEAIKLIFNEPEADSLISCCVATACHPRTMYSLNKGRMASFLPVEAKHRRRQELETLFMRNGAIFISTRELIMERGRIIGDSPLGYIMPVDQSINIDEPIDLELAEFYIKRRSSLLKK